MSFDKTVIITSEFGEHTFTLCQYDRGFVKVIYDELETPDMRFALPAMSKEEFKTLVDSVNHIMGWDI